MQVKEQTRTARNEKSITKVVVSVDSLGNIPDILLNGARVDHKEYSPRQLLHLLKRTITDALVAWEVVQRE